MRMMAVAVAVIFAVLLWGLAEQLEQGRTLARNTEVLESQLAELRVAADERARTVKELRARFDTRTRQSERLQRRTLRFVRRLAKAVRQGRPLPRIPERLFIVSTGGGGKSGGGGGGSKPTGGGGGGRGGGGGQGGDKPTPPGKGPPGKGNPKACQNPGKACDR